MLFQLIHLAYKPGTSLRDHAACFKNQFLDHVETIKGHPPELRFLEVSQGMAAILFLKSLRHDTSLLSLVQSSYDLTPFTLDTVSNRIMLEDSRRESHDSETTYAVQPSKPNFRQRPKARSQTKQSKHPASNSDVSLPRPVSLTRKAPVKKDLDIQTRVNHLAEELKKLQSQLSLNAVKEGIESDGEDVADQMARMWQMQLAMKIPTRKSRAF